MKPMGSSQDAIYEVMKNGNFYTIWDIRKLIALRYGIHVMETTISAKMRSFRWLENRVKYKLSTDLREEVLIKEKRVNGGGYLYKLIIPEIKDNVVDFNYEYTINELKKLGYPV